MMTRTHRTSKIGALFLLVAVLAGCGSQWIQQPSPAPEVVRAFEPVQLRADTGRRSLTVIAPVIRSDTLGGTRPDGASVALALNEIEHVAIRAADIRALPIGQPVLLPLSNCRQPEPGRMIRCRRLAEGRLVSLTADLLMVAHEGERRVYPLSAVQAVRTRLGRRGGRPVTGAIIGLLGGTLLGAAIGSTQEFCVFTCSPATGLGAVLGAPIGLLLGTIIGATIRTDRWEVVRIENIRNLSRAQER